MYDAILAELSEIKTWVAELPGSSEEMPKMVFEDCIYLIEFDLGIIPPDPRDADPQLAAEHAPDPWATPDPRRAVCILWPRLCKRIEKAVDDDDDLYTPPWW